MKRPTRKQRRVISFIEEICPDNWRVLTPFDNSPDSPMVQDPPPNTLFIKVIFSNAPHPKDPEIFGDVPDPIKTHWDYFKKFGITELRLYPHGDRKNWKVTVIHELAHIFNDQRFWLKATTFSTRTNNPGSVVKPLGRHFHGPNFQQALLKIIQGAYANLGKRLSRMVIREICQELENYNKLFPNPFKLSRVLLRKGQPKPHQPVKQNLPLSPKR